MPKTRAQKEELVVKLKEKLEKSKALVFADYKGLTMSQLSNLRDKLKDQQAEFSITKNTLLERALQTTDYRLPTTEAGSQKTKDIFQGPTATLFAYDDEISPIKTLVKAFKDFSIGKVKMGYLGKESLTQEKIIQLSTLPSKDELRGKVVGVLVAPLTGMLTVLNGNLRGLVYALDQIRKSKGGE